jgi:LIVCS family branched-chain amino acid:cation transporter
MTLFNKQIKNDNSFKYATYVALIVSVLTVVDGMGIKMDFIHKLPFDSIGFNWIVPVLVGGIVGNFIPSKNSIDYSSENEQIM